MKPASVIFLSVQFSAVTGWTQQEQLTRLAGEFGRFYREGRYSEAEKTAGEILSLLEKSGSGQGLDAAAVLNNLGSLAYVQGKTDTAESFFERSLRAYQALVGPDHIKVAEVLYNLAGLHLSQGRYDRAETLYKRSLEIRRSRLGREDPSVADALNNLGFLYMRQTKYRLAEQAFRDAWMIWRNHSGAEIAALAAVTLNNIGFLRSRQNLPAEAETYYNQALSVEQKFWGKDHPEAATTLMNLAELHRAGGRSEDADRLYREAADILEKALGPEDPLTRETRKRIGDMTARGIEKNSGGDESGTYQIIMVRTRGEAEGLLERIRRGEKFDELATAHSIDPTAPDRGYFKAKISDLREELRSRLEQLDEGEVSDVFELNRNWAIVRKAGNRPH